MEINENVASITNLLASADMANFFKGLLPHHTHYFLQHMKKTLEHMSHSLTHIFPHHTKIVKKDLNHTPIFT